MKLAITIFLSAALLVACKPADDRKPVMEQERATLDKARQVDSALQQQAELQRQEADKQTQ